MVATKQNKKPVPLFLLVAGMIYLGNLTIGSIYHAATALPIPEWMVGFDLLFLVPIAYLVLMRPSLRKTALAFFALASLGVLVGPWIIPQADKHAWLILEKIRWLYLGALALGQLALVASVIRHIRHHWSEPNLEFSVSEAIANFVPETTVARLLQADARVWLYAIVRNSSRFVLRTPAFYASRHDSNASNQQAFLFIIAAEIPVMHVIVYLFSPPIATVLTAFSLYGLLFLYAEYRATLLRATTLEESALHIRHGVLGDLQVPYSQIKSVQRINFRPRRHKFSLRFVGTGTANIMISLSQDSELQTLIGCRSVNEVYIGLDEPASFERELSSRLLISAKCQLA